MPHTHNRLEDQWSKVLPLLKQEWPLLSVADWESVDQDFDQIVDLIRARYGGRAGIIQEASIRQRINQLLKQVEAA